MNKAQKIIDLLSTTDLSNQQIADRIGCLDAYVRVVKQRLVGTDWAHRTPALDLANRRQKYADDPAHRARRLAINRRWRVANRDHMNEYLRQWRKRRAEARA